MRGYRRRLGLKTTGGGLEAIVSSRQGRAHDGFLFDLKREGSGCEGERRAEEEGKGAGTTLICGSADGVAGRTKAGRRLQALWLVDREEWLDRRDWVGSALKTRKVVGRLEWIGQDPEEGGTRWRSEWVAARGGWMGRLGF